MGVVAAGACPSGVACRVEEGTAVVIGVAVADIWGPGKACRVGQACPWGAGPDQAACSCGLAELAAVELAAAAVAAGAKAARAGSSRGSGHPHLQGGVEATAAVTAARTGSKSSRTASLASNPSWIGRAPRSGHPVEACAEACLTLTSTRLGPFPRFCVWLP